MRLLPFTVLLAACGGFPALDVQTLELTVINEGRSPHFEVKLSCVPGPGGGSDHRSCPVPAAAVLTANGSRLAPAHRAPLDPDECNAVWFSEDLAPLKESPMVLDLAYQGAHLQAHYTYVGDKRALAVTPPTGGVLHDADVVSGSYQSPAADLKYVAVAFMYGQDLSWSDMATSPVADGKWQVALPRGLRKGSGFLAVWGYADPPTLLRCDFAECSALPTRGLIVNGQVEARIE